MDKYGGLSLYDIDFENRYIVDDEDIFFVNKYAYDLIGNPDHPYGNVTDPEYYIICDDLFERILETEQNYDIVLKVISKDVVFPLINKSSKDSSYKLRKMYEIFHRVINSRGRDRKSLLLFTEIY